MTLLLEIAQQSASGTLGDLWDDVYIAKGFRTVHWHNTDETGEVSID